MAYQNATLVQTLDALRSLGKYGLTAPDFGEDYVSLLLRSPVEEERVARKILSLKGDGLYLVPLQLSGAPWKVFHVGIYICQAGHVCVCTPARGWQAPLVWVDGIHTLTAEDAEGVLEAFARCVIHESTSLQPGLRG